MRVILPQVKAAIDSEFVEFYGLHFHVGSQILNNDSHLQALDVMLDLVTKIKVEFDCDVKELNVGGGFGVTYVEEKRPPFSYYLDPIMKKKLIITMTKRICKDRMWSLSQEEVLLRRRAFLFIL